MTKRFFALLMAVVMVLALSVPAFAADPVKNTISTTDDHTYEVYQIFTGDYSEEILSNVKWGANAKTQTLTDPNDSTNTVTVQVGDPVPQFVLDELAAIDSTATDQTKLAAIEKYVDFGTEAFDAVTKSDSAEVVTGYYILKDLGVYDANKQTYSVPENEEYSEYLAQIVGDTKISPKKGTTTTEKKVGDVNDSDPTDIVWEDSADHDIGDNVPFQLTAKISADYDNYQTYYFAFHDKQSAGLKFNANSVKVYVDGHEIDSGYSVVENPEDKDTFDIVFANLKTITYTIPATEEGKDPTTGKVNAKSVITAEYTSKLLESAVTGSEGNENEMHGEFSNNPNDDQHGTTTPDTVIVFTFELDVDKTQENPAFDSTKEESETNKKYLPLKGAGFTVYKFIPDENGEDTYNNVNGTWTAIGDEKKGEAMTTFTFKGLDDGIYKLSETTTPAGFNTAEDIIFTITATHDEEAADPKLQELVVDPSEKLTVVITKAAEDPNPAEYSGIIDTDVLNQKGSVLPETGGIGTTIFYVVGAVLVVGAAVILFAKKKVEE